MPVRCLIVDDSPTVLHAVRELLERGGLAVVGVAATGDDALRLAGELEPDVTLIDIDLGLESGFDLARRLSDDVDTTTSRNILISTHDEEDFADLVAASPAIGFIAKSELSAKAILMLLDDLDGDADERRY